MTRGIKRRTFPLWSVSLSLITTYYHSKMPNKEQVEGIAASIAGSVVGNKAADKAHLGGAGHMAAGILGGIGGGEAEQKLDEKKDGN
ncbi:hypothetical protein I9W82_002813 [Candida metapsilosis]|uniref:Uncharacterized protein n=1 Tax=Candida metapsilosis TaxID=273372 RepID=A0A8H8DCQ6_9ASCO|nr:hypothetical protein I9W82_002813 [Candida metapsilosis]